MNTEFIVKINNNLYCGKCGYLLDSNDKEIIKHIRKHGADSFNEPKKLEDIKAYKLTAFNDFLLLQIYQATGNECDFNGIIWNKIYSCKFYQNMKFEENGEFNIYFWQEMLELNMLFDNACSDKQFNLNDERIDVTINKVFKGIAYVDSLSSFIKRFFNKNLNKKEIDYKLLEKIGSQKISLFIGKKYNGENRNFCQIKEIEVNNEILFSCCCIHGNVINGKFEEYKKHYVYISKDFFYNPDNIDIYQFIKNDIVYSQFRYKRFCDKYPLVKLNEYINSGGKKYIEFLLSENNDNVLELTGKAGLGHIANILDSLNVLNKEGKNLKEIFKLPIKALRNINNEEICKNMNNTTMKALQEVYNIQPAIFNEKITLTEIRLILSKFANIGVTISIFKKEPKSIMDYCRYCKDLDDEDYRLFVDYSNMCNIENLWPYKKFPEKNKLKEAHDLMINYTREKALAKQNEQFEFAVNTEAYNNFLNVSEIFLSKYPYVILKPRNAQDLIDESYNMRNCVRSYISQVANRSTYILFLRYKENKSKSFITIEVNNMMELMQVKAKCNAEPPQDVKEWIKKYCSLKDIDYSFCWDLR